MNQLLCMLYKTRHSLGSMGILLPVNRYSGHEKKRAEKLWTDNRSELVERGHLAHPWVKPTPEKYSFVSVQAVKKIN